MSAWGERVRGTTQLHRRLTVSRSQPVISSTATR